MFLALWIVLIIIFLVLESLTVSLVTIWFVGGSLVALLLSLLNAPFIVQIIGFLVTSLLLLYYARPLANRYMRKTKTNVDALVGKECLVIEDIDTLNAKGVVKINGIEWSARTSSNEIILKDSIVIVEKVEGVKLIVDLKRN